MINPESLTEIELEGQRLAQAVRRDPSKTVPQYPHWTLADLAAHTGSVHALATLVCRDLPTERVTRPTLPPGVDVLNWYEKGLDDLVDVLSHADPSSPCWGFGPGSNVNRWKTRMVVETGMHRWDADQTLGRGGRGLTEVVARSGLDEFADMWWPLLGDVRTLQATATDLGRSWVFGDGPPVVFVEATASDLYLRLMTRESVLEIPDDWASALHELPPPPEQ